MKKYLWIVLIIGALLAVGLVYFFAYKSPNSGGPNYLANRSSYDNGIYINEKDNNNLDASPSSDYSKPVTIKEIEIASFSTRITNKADSNRQGNITITCNCLNNTLVGPGDTFSFCDTVGRSTADRGYKKANVIVQGEEVKALGGGNCQVSSTLYNAVLAVPDDLEVVERHPHSAPVPYIESGKDAAISYGSHDFKFKNNSDSQVKIIAENTPDNVSIKLIKLIKE